MPLGKLPLWVLLGVRQPKMSQATATTIPSSFHESVPLHFAHLGLESGIGYGFWGNYGIVWTSLSFQFQMSKRERKICEFEMDLKNFFCLRSNLNNIFLPKGQVWKRVWILEIWSENGCGKLHLLIWNRVRIWKTGRHTPTKNSQEYRPGIIVPKPRLQLKFEELKWVKQALYKQNEIGNSTVLRKWSNKFVKARFLMWKSKNFWVAIRGNLSDFRCLSCWMVEFSYKCPFNTGLATIEMTISDTF